MKSSKIEWPTRLHPAVTVLAIILSWAVSAGIVSLALPLYIDSLGFTKSEWGLLAGVMALALTLTEAPWGWVSDKVGVALPIGASRLVAAGLLVLLLWTRAFPLLLGIQFVRGAVEVVLGPLGRKSMLCALGAPRRATALGLYQAAQAVGTGAGLLLGGAIISAWSYAASFQIAAGFSLLGALLVLSNRRELSAMRALPASDLDIEHHEAVAASREDGTFIKTFAVLSVIAISVFTALSVTRSFVPLLGTSALKLPPKDVALVLSLSSLLSGILMVGFGRISDRVGRKPLILLGACLLALAMVGYAYTTGMSSLVLSVLAFSIGNAAAVPVAAAWVSDISPHTRQGQMIGIYGAFEDVGLVAGPLVAGFTWDAFGPRDSFLSSGIVVSIGIIGALVLREKRNVPKSQLAHTALVDK